MRAYSLGTAPPDQPPVGLSILLQRGLAAWLDWRTMRPQPRPVPPPPAERPARPLPFVAPAARPDAVLVLASMALSNWAGEAR